jgi:hypothetical protein
MGAAQSAAAQRKVRRFGKSPYRRAPACFDLWFAWDCHFLNRLIAIAFKKKIFTTKTTKTTKEEK